MGINVLSLFDGMSCGQIALEKAGIEVDNYFASEIKKHAIQVTQENYPNTIQLGDITLLDTSKLPKIDLLIGGSPCQNLSFINKHDRDGLDGKKSVLFYQYLRVLKEVKPRWFLLENVASMKNIDRDYISSLLGLEPIKINSSLLSAQIRNRYYWTNIPNIEQPLDLNIKLGDVIDVNAEPEEKWTDKKLKFITDKLNSNSRMYVKIDGDKSIPITARGYQAWNSQFVTAKSGVRDLTIKEFKKLQTIPDKYHFNGISKSKITDLIGDGWTVDVIVHILKNIK